MTDKEKLQRLFDAALKDTSEVDKSPTRSFPKSPAPVPVTSSIPEPVTTTLPEPEPTAEVASQPAPNLGLDEKSSSELALLLDAQNQRKARKLRRDAFVTLAACFALAGGSFAWFVQSPQRVQAFQEAVKEVRSAGDIASILSKYQKAVDRIGVRSDQINQATESMGVSSNQEGEEDPNLEAEMLAMTGGEGNTVGQRNQLLQEKFGKMAEKESTPRENERIAKTSESDSFDAR